MEKIHTSLRGVIKILPKVYKDHRGYFLESYSKRNFKELGIDTEFENAYHFKIKEYAKIELPEQTSIIRILTGSVSVIIKNNESSETTEEIIEDNTHCEIYVPKGHNIELNPLISGSSVELLTDLPLY